MRQKSIAVGENVPWVFLSRVYRSALQVVVHGGHQIEPDISGALQKWGGGVKLPEYSFCPKCGGDLDHRIVKPQEPKRLQCRTCQFIFFLDPKVAAGTIVSHQGQVLLLKRGIEPSYGKWVFPGGFVDRGEKLEDAAIRETQEECLVTVAINRLLGVYSYVEYPVIMIVFVADLIRGEADVGDETLEVKYFDPSQIPWNDLAFPSTEQALRDFLGQGNNP